MCLDSDHGACHAARDNPRRARRVVCRTCPCGIWRHDRAPDPTSPGLWPGCCCSSTCRTCSRRCHRTTPGHCHRTICATRLLRVFRGNLFFGCWYCGVVIQPCLQRGYCHSRDDACNVHASPRATRTSQGAAATFAQPRDHCFRRAPSANACCGGAASITGHARSGTGYGNDCPSRRIARCANRCPSSRRIQQLARAW